VPLSSLAQSSPSSSFDASEPSQESDVQEVTRHHEFQISMPPFPSSAPPGCRVEETSPPVCRADGKPAKSYEVRVSESTGWNTHVTSSELVNGCVILHMQLSVDHTSPNYCRAPLSRLKVLITLR
jgi:hypothetical protein